MALPVDTGGIPAGNVAIAFLAFDNLSATTPTVTAPAGWTEIAASGSINATAAGAVMLSTWISDGRAFSAGTQTFTLSGAVSGKVGYIYEFSGASSGPIDSTWAVNSGTYNLGFSITWFQGTGWDPTNEIYIGAVASETETPPTFTGEGGLTGTEHTANTTGGGAAANVSIRSIVVTAALTTGTDSMTVNNPNEGGRLTFRLRAASNPPTNQPVSETHTATHTETATLLQTTNVPVAEINTVSHTETATILQTHNKSVSETHTGTHTETAAVTITGGVAETHTVTETESGTVTGTASITETHTATHTETATVSQFTLKQVSETHTASHTESAVVTGGALPPTSVPVSETHTATHGETSSVAGTALLAETHVATETEVVTLRSSSVGTETHTVTETEAASVLGTRAPLSEMHTVTQTETVNVLSTLPQRTETHTATHTEAAVVTDVTPPPAPVGQSVSAITFKVLNGGQYYELPDMKAGGKLSYEFSDVGAIAQEYPTNGVNASQLVDNAIVIAYCDGTEMYDSRYMIQGGGKSDEGDDFTSIKGKNLFDVFRRTIVLGAATAISDRVYTNRTVGWILVSLFQAAQTRGAMTGLTWSFTSSNTSSGVAWSTVIDGDFRIKAGRKYIDVIRDFVAAGFLELRFNGTVIEAYNGDAMGVDRSLDDANFVELHRGHDYVNTPHTWTSEGRAKYSLIVGDEDAFYETVDPVAVTGPFGREEMAISQGGTKSTAHLSQINNAALTQVREIRRQYTRELVILPDRPIPNVNYRTSDWIRERVGTTSQRYRVRAIVITLDQDGRVTSGALTLNDRFLEREIRLARRIDGVMGRATSGGGGGPVLPPSDITTPNPPTSVVLNSAAYLNNEGVARSEVTATWTPPLLNTDGTTLTDLTVYEVQWRYQGGTNWIGSLVSEAPAVISNLIPNKVFEFRIRAGDNANPTHWSTWTATSSLTLAGDTTPPPVPSTPVVTVRLGVVTVRWDGLPAMPADFSHVEVHRSQTNGFTPSVSTLVGHIYSTPGWVVAPEQAYNSVWYYKFISVDMSKNKSVASSQATATTTPLVNADLIGQVIANANIVNGTIVASDKIVGNSITGALIAALTVTADKLAANSVTADKITAGAITAEKLQLGVIRSNMCPDPSFEENFPMTVWDPLGPTGVGNVNHWREDGVLNAGCTIANVSAGHSRSGHRNLEIFCPLGQDAGVVSGAIAVEAGKTYQLTVHAGSLTSALASMSVTVMTGTGDATSPYYFNDIPLTGDTDSWTSPPQLTTIQDSTVIDPDSYGKYSYSLTVPAGVTYVLIRILNFNPPAASTLCVEDVSLTEKGFGAAELTAAGLRLIGVDGLEVGAFVHNRPGILNISKGDRTVAAVDGNGAASFTTLEVPGIDLSGDGFADAGITFYGKDLREHLAALPQGIVARGNRTADTNYSSGNNSFLEVGWDAIPGRLYRVSTNTINIQNNTAGGRTQLNMYYTTDGSQPGPLNTRIGYTQTSENYAVDGVLPARLSRNIVPAGGYSGMDATTIPYRVVIVLNALVGSARGYLDAQYPAELTVEDLGIDPGDTGIDRSASNSARKKYTTTWICNSSESYKSDGSPRTDRGDLIQGYYGSSGHNHALALFTGTATQSTASGELSKTIAQAISPASVEIRKAEVFLYANNWWKGSGTAIIRTNTLTSLVNTVPTGTAVGGTQVQNWGEGVGRWIDITSIFTTASRGIWIGRGLTTDLHYYGLFNGHYATRYRPAIRITYVRTD